MRREIYEVYAKVIDANGAYNTLSGYPKVYDSHQNNDDCEKARSKAYAEYYTAIGTMYSRTDRQKQFAMIIRASDGIQIEKIDIGAIADIPDPTFAVTVNNGQGSGEYTVGSNVTIQANQPNDGTHFVAWEGASELTFVEGSATTGVATFIMPSNAVEVTATYEEDEEE